MFLPAIERSSPDAIRHMQEQKLATLLRYLQNRSPFYGKLFKDRNLDIASIKTLEDLQTLPVTTKDDLQNTDNDFLCVPRHAIRDYSVTSGSLGEPVSILLTDQDLDRLAYNEAISLTCAGGSEAHEVYQLMTTVDKRFIAGLAYVLGTRKLGAGLIRLGSGAIPMQWDSILKHRPTTLICIPSFVLKLIEYAENQGIDYQSSSVTKIICIGENIRDSTFALNNLGQRIADKWDVKLYSTYASTEMGCAFTECEHGRGGHHHPELLIIECLDENNLPLAPGELGELTITTLGTEGMPLLRFKTGDLCTLHADPCPCGRTTFRISPIAGRKQQMIKYKGTTLYPPVIYDTLDSISFIKNYLVEISSSEIETDEVTIHAGVHLSDLSEDSEKAVQELLRTKLRVTPRISFKSVKDVERMQFSENSRKPVMFIDRRVSTVG